MGFPSGINNYATRPPHSLTDALGREIEKYDQLCDTVEAHLVSTAHLQSTGCFDCVDSMLVTRHRGTSAGPRPSQSPGEGRKRGRGSQEHASSSARGCRWEQQPC
jgi:hypothetical protein